ncbi:MAG: T9SS type A sorting domain-containing protein [Bacteroidota bacterium]
MIARIWYVCTLLLLCHFTLNAQECSMQVGTNFHFFDAGVFKDLKLSSSTFYTRNRDYLDDGNDWDSGLANSMPQDAQGYPLEVPFTHPETGNPQVVAFTIGGHARNYEAGDYVLLYEGDGSFEFAQWTPVEVTSEAPGRITFRVDQVTEDGIHIIIRSSDVTDHVHNIRIIQQRYEDDFELEPYLPQFMEKASTFVALRFMDWSFTNDHPVSEWNDRPQADFHTQNLWSRGLAWEHMIDLANELQRDVWVNVPHLANDAYIEQMATLFRDRLDADLTIYLEYSNECWNWIFQQTSWLNGASPFPGQYAKNYGYYSLQMMEIWDTVFGGQEDRLQTVLAGHDYFVIDAMDYILDQGQGALVDLVSYPGYVGLSDPDYDALDALGAAATAEEVLDRLEANTAEYFYWMQQFKTLVADTYDKPFVMYEGGQHIIPRVFGLEAPYNQALYEAQTHPRMYDFYENMLSFFQDNLEVTLFMNYVLASPQESSFGSWGLIDNYFVSDDYPPKWRAIQEWIECTDVINSNTEASNARPTLQSYPNPVRDVLQLDFQLQNDALLELYTATGQLLRQQAISATERTVTIDFSSFPPGMYQLVILQGTVRTARRILKTR